MHLEGVGSAQSRRRARDIGPVDPFGFSWPLAVSLRRPPLMTVGFPWISLDSLVRIETFQWVARLLAGRIFLPPCPQARRRRNVSLRSLPAEGAGLFMGQANLFSDFQQEIATRAVPFRPPQSKSRSPQLTP